MTALKSLALAAALIVGTTSLAMAQAQGSGGPDGQAFDGAADNPSAPGSGSSDTSTRAARHHGTSHQRSMYRDVRELHKQPNSLSEQNIPPAPVGHRQPMAQ
jgi:hypothetical protein